MARKILITGGNGFIGEELSNYFANKKYKVISFSRSNQKLKNIKYIIKFQNLTNKINIKFAPDAIIHCAAKHPNSKSGNSMKNIHSTNIKITKNLIKFSNKNHIKKIFFLSSIAAYGSIKNKVVTENQKSVMF